MEGVAIVHPLAHAGARLRPHHITPRERRRFEHERMTTLDQQQPGDGCPPQICGASGQQAIHALEQLIQSLINLFTGVPRSLKSLEVVQRLWRLLSQYQTSGAFHDVARLLWGMLHLIEGGAVLSSGNLTQFYREIFRAAQRIAALEGLPVHQVEQDLTRAIFGDNDGGLRSLLRNELPGVRPTPPQGGAGGGGGQPQPISGSGQPTTTCAENCARLALEAPELYVPCLAACETPFAPPSLARLGRQFGENIGRELTQLFRPTLQPPPQPSRPLARPQQQPFDIPMLDQTTPCPACEGRLARQRADVEQSIRTEQGQQLESQIEQQQQQLEELQQLEEQPALQRDITQELQQKQQLLQQIEQEQQQLERPQSQPQLQPGERAPHLDQPTPQELAQQDRQAARQLEQRAQQLQSQQPGVTFCVGCKSEEDAILFLNGEPSDCSVIPGSTKPLAIGG